jgi:hypothetical protein
LATFCLATYLEKTAFSNDELRTYLSKARTATRIEVDINAYIQDLRESICVLILDGLECRFIHRSFQEYFAAVYLSQADDRLLRRVLERPVFQNWLLWFESDMLIEMLFAINPGTLERNWLLSKLQELKGLTAGDTPDARCIAYIAIVVD